MGRSMVECSLSGQRTNVNDGTRCGGTESINYAVTHEIDGKMSYKLLKDFGVIPSTVEPEQEK